MVKDKPVYLTLKIQPHPSSGHHLNVAYKLPMAIAAVFLQPLYRDLRAFVTQSPWLLRRGLKSDAQSDPFPLHLQVQLLDSHH